MTSLLCVDIILTDFQEWNKTLTLLPKQNFDLSWCMLTYVSYVRELQKRIISNHEFDEIRYHFYVIWIEYSVFTNASFEDLQTIYISWNI